MSDLVPAHGGHAEPISCTVPESERAAFSWTRERLALDGLPAGRGLNIAYEAVDRHAAGALAGKVGMRLRSTDRSCAGTR